MTRMQVLLDPKEVSALRRESHTSGKSYSQLMREAVDAMYIPRLSEREIAVMAKDAKQGKGTKTFKNSKAFLKHLWSL